MVSTPSLRLARTFPRPRSPWWLLALALGSLAQVAPASAGDLLLYVQPPHSATASAAMALDQESFSAYSVRVDAAALEADPQSLWLEVAPGVHRLALRNELRTTVAGGRVWRGRFLEDPPGMSTITLSQHGDLLFGGFALGGVGFTLRPVPDGFHHLEAAPRWREFTCGAEPPAPDERLSSQRVAASSVATSPPTRAQVATAAPGDLAILLAYPHQQAAAWGGEPYVVAHAHHVIDSLNTAFVNSGIDAAAFLAGVRLWTSSETSTVAILSDARQDETLNAYRDEVGADQVGVFAPSSSGGACGYALIMTQRTLGAEFAPSAYGVAKLKCDDWFHRPMLHEIAHNLGAQHEPADPTTPPADAVYPYAYGWNYSIMARGGFHPLFSNPEVYAQGERMGVPDVADNARALTQTVPVAAAWRSGGSPVPRNGAPAPVPRQPHPRTPIQLTARSLSSTEVELAWRDAEYYETGFRIQARAPASDWGTVAEIPRNDSPERVVHVVTDLEPGTRYSFRVLTLGRDGNSTYGNEAHATTLLGAPPRPQGVSARPGALGSVLLSWNPTESADGYEVGIRSVDPADDRGAVALPYTPGSAVLDGLAAATPYTLRLRATNDAGVSPWSEPVSVTTAGDGGGCTAGAGTLCLVEDRFEVRAAFRNPHAGGGHGQAEARPLEASGRTGFFTFFNPANVELGVKILDGSSVNGAFWVFYGSLSDVEYWLSVRDTLSGDLRTYHNPAFELCGLGDTEAFPSPRPEEPADEAARAAFRAPRGSFATLPLPTALRAAAETGPCVPGPEALCLAAGRFRVEVEWTNPHDGGATGRGKVMPGLATDVTGHFWFFRQDNLELSVKILDGTALNGHHWIFWGGLSDVGYTLVVTDTESGEVHRFANPALTLCGGSANDVL